MTELLLYQMDNMVGCKSVAQEETDKVSSDESLNTPKLPDKEFFKNLGVDSGKRLNVGRHLQTRDDLDA